MVTAVMKAGLKLPERTARNIDGARDIQKVQKPHDIRGMIPKVAWTDPSNFPPYQFREYPKMPLLDGNVPIKVNESGDLLIFYDADDEEEFKAMNPDMVEELERNEPTKQAASALAAANDEISELRARLKAAGLDPDPKKSKGQTAGLVRGSIKAEPESMFTTEHAEQAQSTLREQVAAAETGGKAAGNPLRNRKNKAA